MLSSLRKVSNERSVFSPTCMDPNNLEYSRDSRDMI